MQLQTQLVMNRLQLITAALGLLLLAPTGCRKTDGDPPTTPTPAQWDFENTTGQSAGYSECAGTATSPINIDTTRTVKATLPTLTVNYQPLPLQVLDNGHTIQVQGNGRSSVTYDGVTYLLRQFHLHRTSEHTINGQAAPMEVHLVHEDEQTGNRLVLGVFLTNGPQNPALQQVLANLPATQNQPNVVSGVSISLIDLLPPQRAYYTYAASLSTPACPPELTWIVFKNPVPLSAGQEAAFARKYPKNNRPVQPLNNRPVREQG